MTTTISPVTNSFTPFERIFHVTTEKTTVETIINVDERGDQKETSFPSLVALTQSLHKENQELKTKNQGLKTKNQELKQLLHEECAKLEDRIEALNQNSASNKQVLKYTYDERLKIYSAQSPSLQEAQSSYSSGKNFGLPQPTHTIPITHSYENVETNGGIFNRFYRMTGSPSENAYAQVDKDVANDSFMKRIVTRFRTRKASTIKKAPSLSNLSRNTLVAPRSRKSMATPEVF